ncbi:Uma2 family endonuclease [Rhodobium gokarnense]|uniref:Uma2 family endonuclease n=1 Tax=Rhodobium gokarnense TaxID=364296 RepID=A0ABT3HGK6_9HYPH|nr:Uma2 family endonuclease [Rhodobium gokarnense]MCW2309523.1 Uma2 family endonuclease [Rhodobium gokarnense]
MGEMAHVQMTAAEFLAWHEGRDDKWELVGGFPVQMMTGATRIHDQVVVNTIVALRNTLRGSPCRPTTDDIAVLTGNGANVRRPDVTVDCGDFVGTDLQANDPRMVVEVLSKSTRAFDQVQKLEEYKALDTLAYVLFLDTDAPRAKLYFRDASRLWDSRDFIGLDSVVELPELGAGLALVDLYDGLTFEADQPA